MGFVEAVVMGLIQGLTEFLPVSSSGHLAICGILMGFETDASALFDVLLHIGTLVPVVIVLWKDVKMLVLETLKLFRDCFFFLAKKQKIEIYPERLLSIMVIVASVPTVFIGLLVEIFLEDIMLSSLAAVGVCLMITAAILILSKQFIPVGKKDLKDMKVRDGIFIGILQGIATLPGISRSGSTVSAGRFCGLNSDFAFRFSFMASIPAILGAMLLKLIKITPADISNMFFYLVGMLVAAASGYIALLIVRKIINRDKFHYFGYYCAGIGLISLVAGLIIG